MKAEDIPFLAALIFPGFVAIQTFYWATHARDMPDLLRVLWSFIYSVPIFFGLHGLSRHVFRVGARELPSPETVAASPDLTPIWFLVSLYAAAAVAGYVVGQVWKKRLLDQPLRAIGIDLRRHRDVLTQALSQRSHVDIKLSDGAVVRGWPFMFSTEGEKERYVYLTRARRKTPQGGWTQPQQEVLIPVGRIERVYFLDAERALGTVDTQRRQGRKKAVMVAGAAGLAIAGLLTMVVLLAEDRHQDTAYVSRVIDGDTIELVNGDLVQYLGIDTPEALHLEMPLECHVSEAAEANRRLVEGQEVRLERDVSDKDTYGRLLRYVYVGDAFVQVELVRQGHAYVNCRDPDVRYVDKLAAAETQAREEGLGLWGTCTAEEAAP